MIAASVFKRSRVERASRSRGGINREGNAAAGPLGAIAGSAVGGGRRGERGTRYQPWAAVPSPLDVSTARLIAITGIIAIISDVPGSVLRAISPVTKKRDGPPS